MCVEMRSGVKRPIGIYCWECHTTDSSKFAVCQRMAADTGRRSQRCRDCRARYLRVRRRKDPAFLEREREKARARYRPGSRRDYYRQWNLKRKERPTREVTSE